MTTDPASIDGWYERAALRAALTESGFVTGPTRAAFVTGWNAAIAAAEAAPLDVKRGPCVHGNPCRDSDCVEYGRMAAEAAPLDANGDRPLGYYEEEAAPLDVERLHECPACGATHPRRPTVSERYAALRSPDTETEWDVVNLRERDR